MAPSDPPGTVLEDCLKVWQSSAIRILVALVRMIQDLWARVIPRLHDVATGGWGSSGFFCSAPQDFGMLGVFCARAFLPGRLVNYRAHQVETQGRGRHRTRGSEI